MANIINMDGTVIIQDSSGVTVNGVKYDVPKSRLFSQTVIHTGDRLYINGCELVNGKWKMTLRSFFGTLFA